MIQLEKILCFLFTLFVIYLVNKHCKIEGITNLDSFDSCQDDPEWYTLGEGGKKIYCPQIGESASCYNFDERQQEGWERCLKTCGNCAKTKVTQAPQDNLAIYSGETGELYGKAGKVDDSRKFVGLGVGDKDNKDVRSTITSDQAKDIENIQERIETVEDLYDMLLGSVSSCIDCKKHTNQQKCNNTIGCVYDTLTSKCKTKNASQNKFISCNGSELSCEYVVRQNNSTNKNTKSNQITPSTTNNRNTNDIVHKYVKHDCDAYGNCSLMFPTYEFNCNQLPQPATLMENYHTLTYEPLSLNPKKCLAENYINPTRGTNTISSKIHDIVLKYPELQSNIGELHISITQLHNNITDSSNPNYNTEPYPTLRNIFSQLISKYDDYKRVAQSIINQCINLESQIRLITVSSKPTLQINTINTIVRNLDSLASPLGTVYKALYTILSHNIKPSDVNDKRIPIIILNKLDCNTKLTNITKIVNDLKLLLDNDASTNTGTTPGLKQLFNIQSKRDKLVLYNSSINNLITPTPPLNNVCRTSIQPIGKSAISNYQITNTSPTPGDSDTITLNADKVSTSWVDNDLVKIGKQSTSSSPICDTYNSKNIRMKFINNTRNFNLEDDGTIMIPNIITSLINGNCTIEREGSDGGDIIPLCYKLDSQQITTDKEKKLSCARICNSHDLINHTPMSELSKYISVNTTPNGNVHCRCFKEIPTQAVSPTSGNTNCQSTHPYELLDEGKRMQTEQIRSANVNTDEQMRDMCKSYFLLDKSLTGEDMRSNTSSTRDTSGLRNRISLYDMCPKQCRAINCPETAPAPN